MIVEAEGRRYASLADHEAHNPMSPRELVEDVIRRQTDGTLTFRVEEDEYTVALGFEIHGVWTTQGISRELLLRDPYAADDGLKHILAKANASARP